MLVVTPFVFGAFLVYLSDSASLAAEDIIVETENGAVRGRVFQTVAEERLFWSFRGIPYAEPPIGNLRFEPPKPKENWIEILDATRDGSPCIQGSDPIEGAEDCLFINIYSPNEPVENCKLLPTLVWLHGGGFEGGHSNYELYGPDYLLEKDVVIVTFNYRLGFLGFLSTGDEVAPGNNGLKDQVLALKWVKNNIRNFCGDPDQITIGGQSAGSASVAYHIQSPQSEGLFHKAILQSGVSLSLWALSRRVPEITKLVANDLGADISSSRSILEGLKSFNISYLQVQSKVTINNALLGSNPRDGFAIGPVIEPNVPGAFFTASSYELLSSGQFNKVPILIGYNSLEGTFNFELAFRLYLVQYDLDNRKLLPIDMNIASDRASEAAKKLKNYYFNWKPVSLSNVELMHFLSDDQFVRSIREFGRLVQKEVDVYFYRFSYEGGLWGIYNRTITGVSHSEELGYCWRTIHEASSDQDYVVRSWIVTLWTNFIKHSNPTPVQDPVLNNTSWGKLGEELTFLNIGEELVVSRSPDDKNMQFWDDFYEEYGTRPYVTY